MRPSPFMGERHDLVSVEPPDPAVNNPLVWYVPTNTVVQIVSLEIELQTSVAVFDRHVRISFATPLVDDTQFSPAMIVQTADLTWVYHFTLGIAPVDMTGVYSELYQPLGCCYQLQEGSSLIVDAAGRQALDQFTCAKIRYFHWDRA